MVASKVQTPHLRLLMSTLKEWTSVVARVTEAWNCEDVPFWYNERAHVGLFAGAVWLQGGLAFEEYTSTKQGLGGRCDLWFEMKRRAFIAEAKFILCRASVVFNSEPLLRRKLKTAKQAARRNRAWSKNEQRMALLFMAVEVSAGEDVEKALTEWKRQFERVKADGRAWVFPTMSREFRSGNPGKFYPGCAVLLARV